MREIPLYEGAMPEGPQEREQKPGAIPEVGSPGREIDAAIAAGFKALEDYGRLEDYGTAAELARKRKEMGAAMQQEFDAKAKLPWGAEGSFYHEDGSRNEDEMRAFTQKWQEENEKIGSGRWWLRENALRGQREKEDTAFGIALNTDTSLLKGEQENRERLFRDNLELCDARGDYGGACREIDKAEAAGMITHPKAEAMRVRMAKKGVRGSGGGRGRDGAREMSKEYLNGLMDKEKEGEEEQGEGKEYTAREENGQIKLTEYDAQAEAEKLTGTPTRKEKEENWTVPEEKEPGEEKWLADIMSLTPEEEAAGVDLFSKPAVMRLGLGAMNREEKEELWDASCTKAGQISVEPDKAAAGRDGWKFTENEEAAEPMQQMAWTANKEGGKVTLEDVRKSAWAVMRDMVNDENYAGYTDDKLRTKMVEHCTIPGLAEQLFADKPEAAREESMEGMLLGIANTLLETRGAHIEERVKEGLYGGNGYEGAMQTVEGMDRASLMSSYPLSDEEKALKKVGWTATGSAAQEEAKSIAGLWEKHKKRFARETGTDITKENAAVDNRRAFRKWYFGEGSSDKKSVVQEKAEAYAKEKEEFCAQYVAEKLAEWRQEGGAEKEGVKGKYGQYALEQAKIAGWVQEAKKQFKGGGELAEFRETKDAADAQRAAKYHDEAKKEWEKVTGAVAEAKAAQEAAKAQEKERKKAETERKKEEAAAAKAAAAEEERKANPYRYPVRKAISYDGGADDSEYPEVTVPEAEYKAMVTQLGVGAGEGVGVKFGSGQKVYVVKPGKVKHAVMNATLFRTRYKRGYNEQQRKAAANKHKEEMRYVRINID